MIVARAVMDNFRVHERYELACEKKTTLIVGENGIGKTSILEAIYLAMRGRSFKASDKEILRRGAEYYRVDLEYMNGEKVVVGYDAVRGRKFFEADGKRTVRLPKAMKYPIVLFVPEDLHLVATSPTKRRDYFDKIFAQLDEKYHNSLLKFMKVLRQRNELLKEENLRPEMLFSWNVMMAKYGSEVHRRRRELVREMNLVFSEVYRSIADVGDVVELRLRNGGCGTLQSVSGEGVRDERGSGCGGGAQEVISETEYLARLERDFARDRVVGSTGFGVHKDNYEFMFNEVGADGSASRGEVRSVILALKFIEARMMLEYTGRKPLVLLDDVFSELDEMRQRCLVQNFSEHQIILTSVNEVEGL